ncbi:unnamed protein product [Menidia menidia]|uniref:(Atlantic silverside) hypothetical protein n=1 Tax=Menidia menidia TaxID=238744 RepID=A0A8S4AJF4_9TELE|nr:unnamed protein product [Menidia menidia]
MSDQRQDAQPDGAGQSGAVFFSNPLMSDVESDWSPVHDAAFNGRVLNLQRLIAQGACVNLNTLDQVSPLHGACVQGHTACAKLLLESGANVNSSTLDGHTALSEACARGNLTCVSLLLQHGASPLGAGRSNPPLHSAAAEGQRSHSTAPARMVRAGIMQRRQNAPTVSKRCWSPGGFSEPLTPPLTLSPGHPECVEALVRHGADVDQHVEHLGSPLHVACSNRRLDTVRKLLQLGRMRSRSEALTGLSGPDLSISSGARVDGRVSGDSPLHVAARLSSPELVSVLLEHGADRLLLNSEGKRPLDLAPPGSPAGGFSRRPQVLQLLSSLSPFGVCVPLKQLCRLDVRRAVGRRRLGGLPDLDLPAELIGYLLHQSDPGGN